MDPLPKILYLLFDVYNGDIDLEDSCHGVFSHPNEARDYAFKLMREHEPEPLSDEELETCFVDNFEVFGVPYHG